MTMLRVEVSEAGQGALPAVDVDDAVVVIGSATNARIRLPAGAAQREHVRIEGNRWRAIAPVKVDGEGRSDRADVVDATLRNFVEAEQGWQRFGNHDGRQQLTGGQCGLSVFPEER